jgi:hypothetical protein
MPRFRTDAQCHSKAGRHRAYRGRHRRGVRVRPARRSSGPALIAAGTLTLLCVGGLALAEDPAVGSTPAGFAGPDIGVELLTVDPGGRRTLPAAVTASTGDTAGPTATRSTPSRSVRPVAGLTRTQMANAAIIVEAGRALGLPRRAYVIAVACAMQESGLRNLANDGVPESLDLPHQGRGRDHDSVGLFQQRPSAGWGTVRNLMTPAYAARKFYRKLVQIRGWADLPLTRAAQAVQASAFPDAYARHERTAAKVVTALLG